MKKRWTAIVVFVLAFIASYSLMGRVDLQKPEYQVVRVEDSIFENKFYFEELNEEERVVYKELYQGVMDHESTITVHSTDGERTGEIFQSVIYDFPQIFWSDGSAETLTYEESHVELKPTYAHNQEERENMQEEIDACVNQILSGITDGSSEYDKIKYVYETLINTVDYVEGAPDNQNIYSVFGRKQTVCAGYAKANQYLLDQLGVYCIYVVGTADDESHAWNVVRCNGTFCCVDVTWGDPAYSEEEREVAEEVLYDYLCCSDKFLSSTHKKEDKYRYPECASEEWEYYHLNQMFYENADRQALIDAMYASVNAKEETLIFKFADRAVYEQAKQQLEGELLDKALTHLCKRYGLRSVECTYTEYEDLNRFIIYWQYQ